MTFCLTAKGLITSTEHLISWKLYTFLTLIEISTQYHYKWIWLKWRNKTEVKLSTTQVLDKKKLKEQNTEENFEKV